MFILLIGVHRHWNNMSQIKTYTEISRKHSDYKNIQVEIDIRIFAKIFNSKFRIGCLFDSFEINWNNNNKGGFKLELRTFLLQKSYTTEKLFKTELKELRKSSIREEFKTFKMVYSFQATVAARCYHVYKNTTWDQTKVGDRVLVEIESDKKLKKIDLYCCSIGTNKSKQLDTSFEKFLDMSISPSKKNTVILTGL